MRFTSLLVAITGMAVTGGTVYVARDYLTIQPAAASQTDQFALSNVVVAGRDIAFGQAIEAHMLSTIAWPSNAVPAGTFDDYALLLPSTGDEPRRARKAISQGELVLVSRVSGFGEKVTIVQTLGPNQRAMAIKVNASTGVGGFVTPGDFVDVVLTQGRQEAMRAVTILQRIRVIGVDQDANQDTDAPGIARTVTVEVDPDQGQRLALAQQAGILSLTLRTLDSVEDTPLESIKLSDLLREVSPVSDDAPSRTILVRRANVVTETETR